MDRSSGLSFGHIAYLTFESVLQVVIVSFAGFWCAYSGLLPKQGQKVISRLNVDLFTPCLIFSKLARSLSVAKILEIAVIPIFYAITTGVSFGSGKLMSRILGLDKDESNFVVANSIFGNSNSLPVSLTVSLAYTLPGLLWDEIPNDNSDNVASRGILYLLIFQQIGHVLRWSYGYNTLMRWSGDRGVPTAISVSEQLEVPEQSLTNDSEGLSTYSGRTSGSFSKFRSKTSQICSKVMSAMNPPLWSMVFSVLVACIHPIQHEFFSKDGFINNTLSDAITQLGGISIPLILVVLGSNLYPSQDTPQMTRNYKKMVFGSIVGRMILPSMVMLPIIALAVKYIKVSILDDPIFLVCGFILTISPPAIQLTQITQLNEFFESEMAGVLFWGYVVLSLPVSIFGVSAAMSVLRWAQESHQ
ncbi:LAME_0H03950g1_1 [Lachancea meyersii CBS 8951]|uniref:LAME_0H03950g1_1 n=1 Tax=Lachancea meyersii CBS 8951 TaxID=1266667 RepID=A0A1G4KDS7_9SACH|nr:LAME_0H03950g1_1 [Lachancea meyersii CBS 8951]